MLIFRSVYVKCRLTLDIYWHLTCSTLSLTANFKHKNICALHFAILNKLIYFLRVGLPSSHFSSVFQPNGVCCICRRNITFHERKGKFSAFNTTVNVRGYPTFERKFWFLPSSSWSPAEASRPCHTSKAQDRKVITTRVENPLSFAWSIWKVLWFRYHVNF